MDYRDRREIQADPETNARTESPDCPAERGMPAYRASRVEKEIADLTDCREKVALMVSPVHPVVKGIVESVSRRAVPTVRREKEDFPEIPDRKEKTETFVETAQREIQARPEVPDEMLCREIPEKKEIAVSLETQAEKAYLGLRGTPVFPGKME